VNKVLKKLLIKTKKAVFSQQIGNNSSKFKGEGYDFVELREYQDGEDIRKIDWTISAKMQKTFVKVFYAQRELEIVIVPILNGSVYFGTKILKQEQIAQIVAILGYVSSAQGDRFSSYIANETVQLNSKKTKKLLAVDKMVESIFNYDPIGKRVDYKIIEDQLFKTIKQKSIIFLIGDFFDIEALDLKLIAKKHEIIAIIVRDRFEENPIPLGGVDLVDPQTNRNFVGNIDNSVINSYRSIVEKNDKELYKKFKKAGVEFIKIYTDENPVIKLSKLFR